MKSAMSRRGVNQRELADGVGVTPAQMSRLIKGERGRTSDILNRMASFLGVSPEAMFRASGALPNNSKDPWADEMQYKINQLTGIRRELAERLLNSLLADQDAEQIKSTKPALK